MPEPIPIRAHHFEDVIKRKKAGTTKEQLAEALVKAKYLTNYNPNHPLVDKAYSAQQMLDKDARIKLIAGEKDSICEKCPTTKATKEQLCYGKNSDRHYQDIVSAARLGLEINREYELKKLRKKWA